MIEFESGITPEAVEFVRENLKRIGRLESIGHERDIKKVIYVTTFKGTDDTMIIYGGLASGFDGSGPDALFDLLVELGVDGSRARDEVYRLGESKYRFEVEI